MATNTEQIYFCMGSWHGQASQGLNTIAGEKALGSWAIENHWTHPKAIRKKDKYGQEPNI